MSEIKTIWRVLKNYKELLSSLENSQKVFEELDYKYKGVWVINNIALGKIKG